MSNTFQCVIDASVSIKQFIPDPLSGKVKQLFSLLTTTDTNFFVPDLFYIELTNILWKYVKAGQYKIEDAVIDLGSLKGLPLQIISTTELMESAFLIAANYQISAYDASYVALSQKVNAPLLTLDKKLVNCLTNSPYSVENFANFSLPDLPNIK
jgi:predicted nucleic acid-binding protein